MEYKLKEKTINTVLNYLAKKPFVEVAGMIHDLQTAIPINEPEKDQKTKQVKDK